MFKTADLCDDHSDSLSIAQPLFQDYGKNISFCGEISTVKCFEDNSLVRKQLEQDGKGRVLVVDGGGSTRCAMVGDILAQMGTDNGWNGIIVYGCIRDSGVIATISLGVKAIGTLPLKSVKKGEGEIDIPVHFADADFIPGQFAYADEDGIILSPTKLV
ncbi:MAG: ribonuclease E activity regulator RraA [Gammaproteobacteria bacterium]